MTRDYILRLLNPLRRSVDGKHLTSFQSETSVSISSACAVSTRPEPANSKLFLISVEMNEMVNGVSAQL